jgi:hypothetical protein
MSYTNLRPNLYMQGLLMIGRTIATEGRFFAPAGDARVSVVDVRDIAAVAALTKSGYEGKTYDITGPEALTHAEMAAQLSEALHRPVAFVDVPEQKFREALRGFHMPDWQADGLVEDYAHYRRGEASNISSAVREVTAESPRPFKAFAHDYKSAFLDTSDMKSQMAAAAAPCTAKHFSEDLRSSKLNPSREARKPKVTSETITND